MIYILQNGKLIEAEPYDSIKINQNLKTIGINAKKIRRRGKLYIEVSNKLSPEQLDQAASVLSGYDLHTTRTHYDEEVQGD